MSQPFGLIGSITASPGQTDSLASILERAAEIVRNLPGSRLYLVAADHPTDTVWVVEVWESETSHAASLQRPEVLQLIAEARPLIAAMGVSLRFEARGFLGEESEP